MPKPRNRREPRPHDELFKKTFGEIRHARALLQRILPAAIVPLFDWGTLAEADSSFITRELRKRQSDLLFTVRLRESGAVVFILLEHQSGVDFGMPLRMARYMVQIWERRRRKHPNARRLPPIVPVVVHNGRWGWRSSPGFRALYDLPPSELDALLPHLADFAFVLSDLRQMTDDELLAKATPVEGLTLHCLAHHNDPERLLAGLPTWIRVVRCVETEEDADAALCAATEYICRVPSGRNKELASKFSSLMAAEGEENIVGTIAQLWEDQGRAKGLTEGRAKGLTEGRAKGLTEGRAEERAKTRSLLLRQLTIRFGPVGEGVKARIDSAHDATITRWAEQLMTAGKLADVFRAPATRRRVNGARKTKTARAARATRRG
jgi:predicted transposase YdaD